MIEEADGTNGPEDCTEATMAYCAIVVLWRDISEADQLMLGMIVLMRHWYI